MTEGNICVTRINVIRLFLPRNLNRVRPYPARQEANTDTAMENSTMTKLFLKYVPKGYSLHSRPKASKDICCGTHLGGLAMVSP